MLLIVHDERNEHMRELRKNPITGEWVIISSARSARPVLPENACPLCPGVLELEEDYDLAVFDNRFPALSLDAPEIIEEESVVEKGKAIGKCEVIMYTSNHNLAVPDMPVKQLAKLIEVWCDRHRELSKNRELKYIYIFENRGREVGATLDHAHGQLYAFPYLPPRVERKIEHTRQYYLSNGNCSLCDVLKDLPKANIIKSGKYFVSLVPPYARFPYECHIYPLRHVSFLTDLTAEEKWELAEFIRDIAKRYDSFFEEKFPYMMMLFSAPYNTNELYDEFFHFHIEFNPPKRSKDKMKWMASVETGSWNFINPASPEEVAKELREALD